MVSLEKLTQMVVKALGFELSLLNRIVVNSRPHTRPLLSVEGHEELLRRLKRRRDIAFELLLGNRSMELLAISFKDAKDNVPSHSV